MSLTRCPFCDHGNPADSKFCSECGGALHLVPCPRCGAVSQVTATVCYQCGGPLVGRGTDAPVPSAPAAGVSWFLPRRVSRVIVATAFLALIAVLGYTAYRQRSPVDATQPRAASSDATGRGAPAGAGVIGRDGAAGDARSARADRSDGLTAGPAVSPAGSSLAAPARAAANPPRAGRRPVKSQEAKAAAIMRPQAADAGRAGGQELPRSPACTEALAALGLCATKPEAGKEGGQEPSRAPECTAAAAALGLCAPGTTQRRE
jgi:hypothetical protein